jgi:putative ABC transport system permease protein
MVIETNGQQVSITGTISLGGGFGGDGFMVVSDQTFLRLFPARSSGAPNHVLLNIESGEDANEVSDRIRKSLATESIIVRPFSNAIEDEITYQTTRRPVGLIFGLGVAIGTLVGLVIVYQILSTDVADHLSEYATFKAIGYDQKFFRSVVLEEAVILALVGFFPALFVTIGIYSVMANATGLPIAMSPERAMTVLVGTIVSCALSGFLAMRKLEHADPADLF